MEASNWGRGSANPLYPSRVSEVYPPLPPYVHVQFVGHGLCTACFVLSLSTDDLAFGAICVNCAVTMVLMCRLVPRTQVVNTSESVDRLIK